MHIHAFWYIHPNQHANKTSFSFKFKYRLKTLTVPERISCGQQFSKNGRQTRRSSNDILDLAEPVI
jgi:hypothetical protein